MLGLFPSASSAARDAELSSFKFTPRRPGSVLSVEVQKDSCRRSRAAWGSKADLVDSTATTSPSPSFSCCLGCRAGCGESFLVAFDSPSCSRRSSSRFFSARRDFVSDASEVRNSWRSSLRNRRNTQNGFHWNDPSIRRPNHSLPNSGGKFFRCSLNRPGRGHEDKKQTQ